MAQLEMLEGKKAKLTITIPGDVFEKATEAAYRKTAGRYTVPGFRKGKAPRRIIESAYGEGVFYEDAFDAVWGAAYDAAIAEHDLVPVDQPALDINKIGKEGVEFVAIVQLQPDVTLGQYKGVSVPKSDVSVSDADVDKALGEEREKQARFPDVDRPAESGDRLLLDYSGSVIGETVPENETQDFHQINVETVEKVIAKDITVTFPAEYHATELAGKEAVFACNVKAVQVKELPEIDDDFIADISEFDTVAEWKADKKEKMIEEKRRAAANARENAALKRACDNAAVEIPDVMIDRETDRMVRDLEYRLSGSGLDMNTYCQYLGTTVEEMKKNFRPDAAERVKMQLLIDAVIKAEALTVTDEEIDAEIDRYAEANGMVSEDLKPRLTEDDRNYFKERATVDKAVRLIADSAVETSEEA